VDALGEAPPRGVEDLAGAVGGEAGVPGEVDLVDEHLHRGLVDGAAEVVVEGGPDHRVLDLDDAHGLDAGDDRGDVVLGDGVGVGPAGELPRATGVGADDVVAGVRGVGAQGVDGGAVGVEPVEVPPGVPVDLPVEALVHQEVEGVAVVGDVTHAPGVDVVEGHELGGVQVAPGLEHVGADGLRVLVQLVGRDGHLLVVDHALVVQGRHARERDDDGQGHDETDQREPLGRGSPRGAPAASGS
jgi:hypothetical protein